jgi:hypothetical protein
MLVLFALYLAMNFKAMPEVRDELRAQTELLNTLDRGLEEKPAHN